MKKLTIEDFDGINMSAGGGGSSKYPWDETAVGEGFSIPLAKLRKTDYRPTPPTRLVNEGMKFISRKTSVDGVDSIDLQRVA